MVTCVRMRAARRSGLAAAASCDGSDAGNPCVAWFQWWAGGSSPSIAGHVRIGALAW